MIRAVLVALGLACLAGGAKAQDRIAVQSGEHARFSRLVFPASGRIDWRVDRPGPGRVEIAFTGLRGTFDLDEVFRLIPRDRLEGIAASPNGIVLSLACDCPVSVSQIASDHIVIDISDPAPTARAVAQPPVPTLPLRLPQAADFAIGFPPSAPMPPIARAGPDAPAGDAAAPLPQVAIRPFRAATILPGDAPEAAPPPRPTCDGESRIAQILLRDPEAELAELPGRTATLFDTRDTLMPGALRDLAERYAALGWGAETRHVLKLTDNPDPILTAIALAAEGSEGPPGPDPACGPGSVTLALLVPGRAIDWRAVDSRALARFLAALPAARWQADGPRLRARLEREGQAGLLLIRPDAEMATEAGPPGLDPAAGTGPAAIEAVIARLEDGARDAAALSDLDLANAVALRPSLPAGEAAARLDAALALSLVTRRRLADAAAMVRSDRISATAVLDHAREVLRPGDFAELAIRIRNHVAPGSDPALNAAAILDRFGLPDAAGAFLQAAGSPRDVPRLAARPVAIPPAQPWLERDLVASAEGAEDIPAPRAELARFVLHRNRRASAPAAPGPDPDLAAAQAALADSRRLAALVSDLLALEGAIETPR
ncbi:hypothetical protein [Jannaschia ovalis]|uniref:Uncharacterized protein n=1 Tax=Jannaschia ovalis TaxID=3038773 RepID=A0ABY8LFT9_9RHOB|nr:hypothetical protein [Jannaschia sp. GRR-S6-38]WGH80171.1 hypothetical protein P8627_07870 [Jannaschia sp. GRR-S6-38]